jgi:plasmid maintenance system antidote protein VapI
MSRKVLTLSERVEAIKLHDCGKSSQDVAQIMGVGRMQIQQFIKRKSEVLDDMKIINDLSVVFAEHSGFLHQ